MGNSSQLGIAVRSFEIREAREADFESLLILYHQLQPEDPVLTNGADLAAFQQIISNPDLYLFVAASQSGLIASTYLNVIPNITRSASPYAIVENVITREDLRGTGIGKTLI